MLGFSQNMSTGALTTTPGTVITTDSTGKTVATGYGAGTTPSAIAEDPSSRFVYITDEATNQLYGYTTVNTAGAVVPMNSSQFSTGRIFPVGITIDPRGEFLYVANLTSSTVGAYAIDQEPGTPVGTVGSASTATDTAPTCVTVEPAASASISTPQRVSQMPVSAMCLITTTAELGQVQNTPFHCFRTAHLRRIGREWIASDADRQSVVFTAEAAK